MTQTFKLLSVVVVLVLHLVYAVPHPLAAMVTKLVWSTTIQLLLCTKIMLNVDRHGGKGNS